MSGIDKTVAVASLWNAALELKGHAKLSDGGLMMICEILEPYTVSQINKAVWQCMKDPDQGMYHLQPAHVVRSIEGDSETAANKAWQVASKIAKSLGGYDDYAIEDPIIMKCIEQIGGLQELCNQKDDKALGFLGNQFRGLYKHYRINGLKDGEKWPQVLRGTNNHQREIFKLPPLPPRIIGKAGESQGDMRMPKNRYTQIEHDAKKPVDKDTVMKSLENFTRGLL